MSNKREEPPMAVCPSCGRIAEVRYLHAKTLTPAPPRCGHCNVVMEVAR